MKPKLLTTLQNYSLRLFLSDALAGVTVALVALPLSIAIANGSAGVSSPGEITFRKLRDIENEIGQGFSYPSLVRAHDGTFYLTYTWHDRAAIKCVHFDSNWLGLSCGSVGQ